jgi:hypothetical protein
MKSNFTNGRKAVIAFVCFAIAVIGFMIKLPSGFRHIDKELHALFYFMAAAFLNWLFAKAKLLRHIIIFIFLFLFGMAIEYAQQYSNKFFRTRIHGRFDPEDIQSNCKGLLAFSIVWLAWIAIARVFQKNRRKSI